ncbi:MAG: ribosome small subunit-dependent GTPase A [Candidatus Poribacteria bacterium]|nr:ribosome small subunit-dependent GTPase A [Candidatus Poribacteria bacterium]
MSDPLKGQVIRARNNFYDIRVDSSAGDLESHQGPNTFVCQLRGSLKRSLRSETGKRIYADPIAVGDRVIVSLINDQQGVIEDLLPRRTKLARRHPNPSGIIEQIIVANAEQVIIVASAKQPNLNYRFIDRFLILADYGQLDAVVCINKIDLLPPKELNKLTQTISQTYYPLGYKTLFTSIHQPETIEQLQDTLSDKFSVVVGASGVGKSSLLNAVQSDLGLRVGEISQQVNKGRHITTFVELFNLTIGGVVADTPGVREVGLWGIDDQDLTLYFPEMKQHFGQCKFRNCRHLTEPGCRILQALQKGEIQQFRYDSYVALVEAGESNR